MFKSISVSGVIMTIARIPEGPLSTEIYAWLNKNKGASTIDVYQAFSDYSQSDVFTNLHVLEERKAIVKNFDKDHIARFYPR